MFKFELGQEVIDIVTGYKGIISVRSQYLTGCNTYGINNRKRTKEDKATDWCYFDEKSLKLGKNHIKLDDGTKGGPQQSYAPQR